MNVKGFCLLGAMLLSSSAALADDESSSVSSTLARDSATQESRRSSEISVSGITQFTRPSIGQASYLTGPATQSSKISYGGSVEYRHWYGNNGFAATYSVVASDANFVSPGNNWQMSLTRHEGTVSYVRRFVPYSRFKPYASIGVGGFITHGGLGWRQNGVWIPHDYLGLDGQFQVRAAVGFDVWHTRHFGIRTGYVVHWFRAPNFSDPLYHASRTLITEPQIGLLWKF